MFFILHKYIFRELAKIFVLATVALTLIMSLGSIVRPIEEYGVGPGQVVALLGYLIPITLTFVLPLSALFAATMVYGRFAADNELDACRASGISLMTLIYPGFSLAIIVAIANLILSFYVVPEFFHRAEKELKADAKQILFRNIERRGFYEEPKRQYRIYADEADAQTNMLYGVIVTRIERGRIRRIITTEQANIVFVSRKSSNEVRIIANNLYQIGDEDQGWAYVERLPFVAEFPSLLGDKIEFKKIDQMKEIRADPLNFYPVEQIARRTCEQFVSELLAQDVSRAVQADANNFYTLYGEPNSVKISAGSVSANTSIKSDSYDVALSGKVTVLEFDTETNEPTCSWYCSEALLRMEGDGFNPTVRLEMLSPRWQSSDGAEGIAAGRKFIRGLLLPADITGRVSSGNVLAAIAPGATSTALANGPSSRLQFLQNKLQWSIRTTLVQILTEIQTRLVFGIGCMPLLVIGIGLGIILRGGHLLSAFGASAIPAGILVICIMMGKNVATNPGASLTAGIVMMWTGFAVMVILALAIMRRLLRN
jgi:lipopolysaccharide export LptBFGC system permease protein LptF